ncbi:MAG: TonB-dependent receptor [Ignavibacteria bacterium]|nr:TonB-dependent receptor [Ignavibacteria bacterium]
MVRSAFSLKGAAAVVLGLLFWCWDVTPLVAQSTGKIAGTVRDKQTGEALVGANIIVKGTTLGAASDENGFYYILRVPPGTFELQFSMVGYRITTVRGVRVQIDLTSEINVQLEQKSVEMGEVVVVAEQKMVQKDVTSTRRLVSRENIRETPGLEYTTDIFKLQAGTILSSVPQTLKLADGTQLQVRDESLKDIHIRGGRGGEILYMVDGMPVTHPIYGGRSVVDLNVVDVESVELLTGAFNAEYGQAQSGVVNITTRTGGDILRGGLEYKTDELRVLGESYNTHYGSFYLGGPEPITRQLLPALGMTIPGGVTFFISGNGTLTNTPYDNHRKREKFALFGLQVEEKQENTQNLNAKINYDISPEHRLTLSYHGSWNQWSRFDWLWRDYPDRTIGFKRANHAVNLQINHVLSKSTYYNVNLGYLGVAYKSSWNGKRPVDFWVQDGTGRLFSTIAAPQVDPRTGFFDERGNENIWRDDLTKTFAFKGDLTSQVHPAHLIKTGMEIRYNDISYIDIQDGGVKLSRYGQGIDSIPPPGPFPEFGQNRWVFQVKPTVAAVYLQDKFELEYLIVNAGLRLDGFALGSTVMQRDWQRTWERATGLKAGWKPVIYKFSPRFGISFPISEYTVVFFSYGHFNQLPELQFYYRDPYSGGFTGNPSLDYEQTILYEFGFTHQLSDFWAIDIKSYAKDISKQVGTTLVFGKEGIPVELYDNRGYARARGLEFELNKRYSDFVSGRATYTIQWTSGYSSSAFDDYIRSQTNFPYPIRERPLGWDVRHQVIFQGTLAAGESQNPSLFGLELPGNWNLTVLYRFSTGQPYTPGEATINPVEAQKRENTATGPSFSSTDLKFEKGLSIFGARVAFTLDIFNLFDQKNIQMSYGFNTWTGKPFRYGDVERPQPNFYDYYRMISIMDPRQFSTGRTTKLGIRMDF